MGELPFKLSQPLTLGIELELQIVNSRDYNLTRGASDLLAPWRRASTRAISSRRSPKA